MSGNTGCKDYLHKEYPKLFRRDQFWNQIKRTVNGHPVSEQDIQLIVDQVITHLDLQPHNYVLDLGCGNGALAARFHDRVQSYTGVDFSRYLLDIADEFFTPNDRVTYVESDMRQIENYATVASNTDKVLIYGCIGYLTKQETSTLLDALKQALSHLEKIFIGNIPNKLRAAEFFASRRIVEYQLDHPNTPLGVWWTPNEVLSLAGQAGFEAEIVVMPDHFYGARCRFDAVLKRPGPTRAIDASSPLSI